jgi:carboxypeptidase C (cathepsin A)
LKPWPQFFWASLFKGNKLDPAARGGIRQRLAYFTGLSEDYVERSDLQVLAGRFLKELLRSEGKAVGRLDGRYAGDDVDKAAELPDGEWEEISPGLRLIGTFRLGFRG